MKQATKKVEEKIKKLENYKQPKPTQLDLFELDKGNGKYSNSIEAYDQIPKYVWGKVERINGKFLEPITRSFKFRGENCTVKIQPANIKAKKGNEEIELFCFPGKREEIVEDALRKIAVDGHSMMSTTGDVGVYFSLYQLQQELAKNGHSYSIPQIKESLEICARTHLSVTIGEKKIGEMKMLEFIMHSDEQWSGQGKKTWGRVKFNSLVSKSIFNKTYRQFNYRTSMQYKKIIARQLHKRISHHYIQAGDKSPPYHLMLSTIIRDFGLTQYSKLPNNLREVEIALDEMAEKGILEGIENTAYTEAKKIWEREHAQENEARIHAGKKPLKMPAPKGKNRTKISPKFHRCKIEPVLEGSRNKLVDAKITFSVSKEFVTDQMFANLRANEIRQGKTHFITQQ